MLLTTLSGNDEVHHYKKSVVIIFGGRRRVLSTAPHNGGYREDLRCVFNHDGKIPGKSPCYMKAPTYAEHMAITAEEIGLDRNTACGISTAADMENLIIKSESYDDITVTALATGGIDVNGGRAGDPATWHEEKEKAKELAKLGTINILLHFNVDLSEGAIARALVTCTEAKSAAIQELQLPSRYSRGLATGSGTDSTIIVANAESGYRYTNTGKHSKLGEIIGRAVKTAVKEALGKQSNSTPQRQHNVIRRMERFGLFEDPLWERFDRENPGLLSRAAFADRYWHVTNNDMYVTYTSLYAHLLDQVDWRLISCREALTAGSELLKLMGAPSTVRTDIENQEECITEMVELFTHGLLLKFIPPRSAEED
ncbi:adenosylcobinamide amidohydrolase [Cloacibacillus porcorum]|uniref:adenosylcobinamide amidohydrolase n=2 Tax=Cloacibacillus porcorum TaxID=1197717 RepID=UPI0014593B1F|nr:adenosylcobinamide amidohydrolase [Cloacibacillus porcorum]MCC8184487.1 adenosylcobinamide amidohydrolase [Cloacibacillus porcorum]MCI5865952.1 adenosylcobinamide amidohydrolase [Cloacibacillus porcorum]MDY5390186.1 adenosylcobinamide amidohydrolase [Cloacibacillus porcorum]NMF18743.1 adenosylcobinamide amidohydrolase [Cloacibacillus porcorum]